METEKALGKVPALIFVVLCFAMLLVPIVQMRLHLFDEPRLRGVTTDAKRPTLSVKTVWGEAFQRDAIAWFDQNYGFRPTLVRLDNSIGYWILQESRTENDAKVGRRRILWLRDHLGHENMPALPRDNVRRRVMLTKRASEAVRAHGKVLVVAIFPGKEVVYPNDIPGRWLAPIVPPGAKRPWQYGVEEPYLEDLAASGVLYVNGMTLLADRIRDEPQFVYSPTGRHTNSAAACLVYEATLALARPHLPGKTIPKADCHYDWKDVGIEAEEFDLWRLLNVWGPPPLKEIPFLPATPEEVPRAMRPNTLIVGSSFAARFAFEAERTHTLGKTHYFWYNDQSEDTEGNRYGKVVHHSPAWRELLHSKDLFIVPDAQDYIPFSTEFFEQLGDAFDAPPLAPP